MVARLALRESYECISTAVRSVVAAVEESTRAVGVGRQCVVRALAARSTLHCVRVTTWAEHVCPTMVGFTANIGYPQFFCLGLK